MSILIAEDDPTIRTNLARLLTLEGFEVRTAENGRMALDMALADTPDLVISDVMMPELDGHGLLKALRTESATAQVPFVFLTARADRSDVREGMTLGADDYLTKPFERTELLQLVKTQLERAEQRSREIVRLQAETDHLRGHDPLTHLPNRHGFEDHLAAALEAATRAGEALAVACINLDGVAMLRHADGARAADDALRAIADRLAVGMLAAADRGLRMDAGRIGDARFAVVFLQTSDEPRVAQEMRPLLASLASPLPLGERPVHLAPTAGVAFFPADGRDVETLLRNAEAAEPPAVPGGALAFHSPDGQAQLSRRARLLQALHGALDAGQLSLHYQPQIASESDAVVGFEALLRWQSPEFGAVSPAEFIPLAEESGLIVPMGTWVLHEAVRQMRGWRDAGVQGVRVAVNLSSRQFEDDSLPGLVAAALAAEGLPADALELEITESIAMKNGERVLRILNALKAQGVVLSMDDFGTGYSSLAYLKRYPIDSLKIDQGFVRHLQVDASDLAICRTIIALARNFDLKVVAEGVETAVHASLLREMGCDVLQGWHFARPMPAAQATHWLLEARRAAGEPS
ncbi:MAG: putative bifunctional diguanylate cyclase/phosphodiesterase [Lysobacteraceae bacterium]|jgi:diguanylate cyclase (GGDEF)-like protein|nr:EAL domain-containing protein [Xanthomonadaceae bacterium]MCZ8319316.1 EAL domain-containing protein [Silanimonas sp.]